MIEPKLKAKNANSGQLFRPGWVSSAECMLHRIEQPAAICLSSSVLVVMTIRMGLNSNACQSNTPHETRDYDSIDKEFEISYIHVAVAIRKVRTGKTYTYSIIVRGPLLSVFTC